MVEIVDPKNVDFDEIHLLLKLAFKERSESNESVKVPSAKALAHKYLNSEFLSKIALYFENNSLIAMNGLIPMRVVSGTTSSIGWMSCDTATHPNYRGRGLFKQCVLALESTLKKSDLIFGFPNSNSQPGFKKLGWETNNEIKLWMSPRSLLKSKKISVEEIALLDFPHEVGYTPGIVKDKHYLTWRYSPQRDDYKIFRIWIKDKTYYAITKLMEVGSLKLTLILETSALPNDSINAIKQISVAQGTHGVLMSKSQIAAENLVRNGFFQVPSKLNPRRIYLSGKFLEDEIRNLELREWFLTLGDFDAL